MPEQLIHTNTHFESIGSQTVLLCDGVNSPANIGGLFRVSDALGVKEIFFCGNTIDTTSVRLRRTSRNTHKSVPFQDGIDIISTITKLSEKGYTPILLELTNKSKALQEYTISKEKRLAIIIGNEKAGVSKPVLEKVNVQLHIEMLGNNSSMNVTQAAAIGLFTLMNNKCP